MKSPHLLCVSQKVKDIKLPANGLLESRMGKLRSWLQSHVFIPGDKFTANVVPIEIKDGVIVAEITGKTLSSDLDVQPFIRVQLPVASVNMMVLLILNQFWPQCQAVR